MCSALATPPITPTDRGGALVEFYLAIAVIGLLTLVANLTANRVAAPAAARMASRPRGPVPPWLLAGGLAVGDVGIGLVATAPMAESIGLLLRVAVAIVVFEGSTPLGLRVLRDVGSVVRNVVLLDIVVN